MSLYQQKASCFFKNQSINSTLANAEKTMSISLIVNFRPTVDP